MSKRQRRRVTDRRNIHMQRTRRRTAVPLAVAAVAAPAVAAPAAQAAPQALHHASLDVRTLTADKALGRADNRLQRERATAARAIANATLTGDGNALYRPKPNRPRRPSRPIPLSPTLFAPVAGAPPRPLLPLGHPPHPRRRLPRLRPPPPLRPRLRHQSPRRRPRTRRHRRLRRRTPEPGARWRRPSHPPLVRPQPPRQPRPLRHQAATRPLPPRLQRRYL